MTEMAAMPRTGPAPDRGEFARRTDRFRRELLVHCYRMLGSVDDAEDLVQETYLRAWRAYDGFQGRSSLRTWMYRIATHACLKAVEHRSRRVLPSGLGAPGAEVEHSPGVRPPGEVAWLRPLPGRLLSGVPDDPAAVVGVRSSVRLAFVAALQHLPARQRAVLLLRDVLAWPASEVADLLGTTTAGVNSALQRARAHLARAAPVEDEMSEPDDPARRGLLDRYVTAFESGDVQALLELLTDDVAWEMPPLPEWFHGRAAVGRFVSSRVFGGPGAWQLRPVSANGQPAVAAYLRGGDGSYHAHAIQVLTLTPAGVARCVAFVDPDLFATFGLPLRR